MAEENKQQNSEPQFQIHKIYIKDLSFEIPDGSGIFKDEWRPELNVDINTSSKPMKEQDLYEVTLALTCAVTTNDKKAFTAEVHQAGLFEISNVAETQLEHALGSYCPSVLYPYLREAMGDMIMKGGFPQLALAPINFDMLYEKQQQEQEQAQKQ